MFDCPFVCGVIGYLFVQVRSDKKVKKTTYVYDKKKLRETDASSYVSRSLSLFLSLSLSLSSEGRLNMLVFSKTKRSPSCRGRLARPATEPEAEEVLQR